MTNLTHQERLLWLAERKIVCGCYNLRIDALGHWAGCPRCHGTGKAARFPSLSRGGVPIDDLSATLLCAKAWFLEERTYDIRVSCRLATNVADFSSCGKTRNEAAIKALWEAVRNEEDN